MTLNLAAQTLTSDTGNKQAPSTPHGPASRVLFPQPHFGRVSVNDAESSWPRSIPHKAVITWYLPQNLLLFLVHELL